MFYLFYKIKKIQFFKNDRKQAVPSSQFTKSSENVGTSHAADKIAFSKVRLSTLGGDRKIVNEERERDRKRKREQENRREQR